MSICDTKIRHIAYGHFLPGLAIMPVSGADEQHAFLRREKMKKLTVIIMVLGLAACAEATIGLPPAVSLSNPLNDSTTPDNVPSTAFSGIVIGIQSDDGSVCIVYLEPINGGGQWAVPARGDIFGLLPDAITIASLGLAGLLLRRRSSRLLPIYRE
jgi:hypothetical protein